MNRTHYFNYIEDKLGTLAYRINIKGRLNILDLHLHSESFYLYFLNKIFGWDFISANAIIKQNVEAIDLIDHTNKLICQISATNTKQKVESALAKQLIKSYPSYTFKFISISKECSDLRKVVFNNPHGITFSPQKDIIDNKNLLDHILGLKIDEQKEVYEFIKKELGGSVDIVKLDSNLASVINILSKENYTRPAILIVNSFEIDRKIDHNNLQKTKDIIQQFAPYYHRVDSQYAILDSQGANKSTYVLQNINKSYVDETVANPNMSADDIFLKVIDNIVNKVLNSANYIISALDELEFCVSVLVVDAFIRCKIFKNPVDYNYAIAR